MKSFAVELSPDDEVIEVPKAKPRLLYGWFSITPRWIQFLNNGKWQLAFLAMANLINSAVSEGLLGASISSVERRFGLSSTQSSWISNCFDLARMPVMLMVGAMATTAHRPRIIAIGFCLSGISSFLFCLPHFITGPYEPEASKQETSSGLCSNTTADDDIFVTDRPEGSPEIANTWFMVIFITARIIMGLASGTRPVMITHLESCADHGWFAVAITIIYISGAAGTAIAFILSAYLLSIFTDFCNSNPEDLGLERSDPRWVGAWWLGNVVSAVLLVLLSFPISGYAKDLPGAAEIRAAKKSEAAIQETPEASREEKRASPLTIIRELFENKCYVFMVANAVMDAFLMSALGTYGVKIVEVQYSISASASALFCGSFSLPAMIIGIALAGAIIKRFKLSCKRILQLEMVICVIGVLATLTFKMHCLGPSYAGVTVPYPVVNGSGTDALYPMITNAPFVCNSDCQCEGKAFEPICGKDGIQYLSPCHAGCADVVVDGYMKEYHNCSCIQEPDTVGMADAVAGICEDKFCKLLIPGGFAIGCLLIAVLLQGTLDTTALLRVVQVHQKHLGVALQMTALTVFGSFTGPFVFGRLIDYSCEVWNFSPDGEMGACLHYDNATLSTLLAVMACACGLLRLLSLVMVNYFYSKYQQQSALEMKVPEMEKLQKQF